MVDNLKKRIEIGIEIEIRIDENMAHLKDALHRGTELAHSLKREGVTDSYNVVFTRLCRCRLSVTMLYPWRVSVTKL
jgi:hypothetical protein